MPKTNSRDAILEAAEKVVIEVGAGHMTLDAVAKKADVSKGGLIYNFPTKDMLLQAMIMRFFELTEVARAKEHAKLPEGRACAIKAHVLSLLACSHQNEHLGTALLAAAAHNPKLLVPVRAALSRIFEEFTAPGLRLEHAAAISLATYGLWLMDLLGVSFFTVKQREAIIAELLRLADE